MSRRRIANIVPLAPTRCAACALPAPLRALLRASQRIAACKQSYRGSVRAVSWALAARCVARHPSSLPLILQMAAVAIQCLYRDQPASQPTLPVAIHSSVLQYKAQSFLPFSHNTTQCIATHLPQQPAASQAKPTCCNTV